MIDLAKKGIFVLACSTTIFAQTLQNYTIENAWSHLLNHSSGLHASNALVYEAQKKRSSAKSMYLPDISLNANYTHMDKPIDIDTSKMASIMASLPIPIPFPNTVDLSKEDIFIADLQMLWPLYTGGKIDAAQDIYAAQLQENQAKLQMKKDEEFITLVKVYYGAVVTKALYKTRKDAQIRLAYHYEDAQKLFDLGQIAKVQLLHAKMELENAKIETKKAQHQYEILLQTLQILTGIKDFKPQSSLFITKQLHDEHYYSEGVKNYKALAVFDAKKKQTQALVKIKKGDYFPTVMGYGDYNLYKDDSPLMKSMPNWFIGVVVRINLLQRGDRAQEIQIAKAKKDQVVYLRAEALEKLKILTQKTYKEMLDAIDQYYALQSSLQMAQENYKLRSISFKEGLSTSRDVVDAEVFIESIETKRLNSAYTFVQKFAQLFVLTGQREAFFTMLRDDTSLIHL